ncbi:MAG: sigma-54-dependent Fis family transcriptional regulator [Candidatus Latescibacterota bacterium]|nr:MAG: sigma-54-dependent Fis family transcriptional regulator [Candidatus Latescibacterota bacterium]
MGSGGSVRDLLLLVDDEPAILDSLYKILKRDGYDVVTATNGRDGLHLLELENVSACLVDYRMPGMDGIEFLRRARDTHPHVEFVVMSGHANVDIAVEAMREGARDFLTKPFTRAQLEKVVDKAIESRHRDRRQKPREAQATPESEAENIIGPSPAMRNVLQLVEQVGPSSATVLIEGESGTGKELIANAIQQRSRRCDKAYVRVNCAAIPDTLMESELFGYEKGAFTGAHKSKKGRFELADGGTIFLDEIGDMSMATQTKVLRVLQEGEFDRVGATRTQRVDVRIIAATNVDLERAVRERRFREDLYYRLRVIQVKLPPLRERKSDIPLLVDHFIRSYSAKDGKRISGIEPAALAALVDYSWPGNVRELENAIERAVVLVRGDKLTLSELPPEVLNRAPENRITFTLGTPLREMERRMIAETLRYTDGDKTKAARMLGITARTIYRKLERRRIELSEASQAEHVERRERQPHGPTPTPHDIVEWTLPSDPRSRS